jgi:hypothetical protein
MARLEVCSRALDLLGAAMSYQITEQMLAAYHAALADLSDEELQTATVAALRTLTFFPKPSELLELARPSQALLAWEVFRAANRKRDGRQAVEVADPVMAHTIRSMGGWARACHLTTDEVCGYYRTEWLKTYREFERGHKRHPLDNFRLLGSMAEPVVRLQCEYLTNRSEIQRIA